MSHMRYGALLVFALLALTACTTTVEYEREPRILYPDARDRYEDVALYKIFHEGKLVGYADSKRLIDGDHNDLNDRYQVFIQDTNRDTVGYVTDHGEAYKLQAHGPAVRMGVSDDLSQNVKSIHGWNTGEVKLQKMVWKED